MEKKSRVYFFGAILLLVLLGSKVGSPGLKMLLRFTFPLFAAYGIYKWVTWLLFGKRRAVNPITQVASVSRGTMQDVIEICEKCGEQNGTRHRCKT